MRAAIPGDPAKPRWAMTNGGDRPDAPESVARCVSFFWPLTLHVRIEFDDLSRPSGAEHIRNMHELSPPDQVFALDASKLKALDVSFWTAWNGKLLFGCAALKELSSTQGEIKSMRTPSARRRTGARQALLNHVIDVARSREYQVLYLRPAATPHSSQPRRFIAAQASSFAVRFGAYQENGNSVLMSLSLSPASAAV